MKVPYIEGLANRNDPESCVCTRKGAGEALTGESAGMVLSLEKLLIQGADVLDGSGRQHRQERQREYLSDPAWSKTHCMHGSSMHGNREVPWSSAGNGPAEREVKA